MKIFRVIYESPDFLHPPKRLIRDKFYEAMSEYEALKRFKKSKSYDSEETIVWNVFEINKLPEGKEIE